MELKVFKRAADKAKWISELLAADIDKMPEPEYWKFCGEYMFFLYDEQRLGKPLGELRLHSVLTFGDWKTREGLTGAQNIVRDLLSDFVAFRDGKSDQAIELDIKFRMHIDNDEDVSWLDEEDEQNLLRYVLVDLLCHFPPSAIKQCANEPCSNFLIQTTKRIKIYCSQKCAWQQTARKARRNQGDEYRKKQSKIMRKRYVEKQKKEVGPNVKVHRRKK